MFVGSILPTPSTINKTDVNIWIIIDMANCFCYSVSKMLSKKWVLFISIFFFLGLSPQFKDTQAIYACNESCALNPAGCNSPLVCSGGLCRNSSCTSEASCICPTATPTPTPTPTLSPWIKLKDSSYSSKNSLTNNIPLVPVSYDGTGDDTAEAYFIINNGGLVAAPSINVNYYNPGAKTNEKDWKVDYTPSPSSYSMTPTLFYSYVRARKEYKKINALSEIDTDGIYYYQGASPLSIASVPAQFNSYKVVLISSGVVEISVADFSPSHSIAIVAPTIDFSSSVTQATGIFIADAVTTGINNNQGLKVVGNLIAQTSLTNSRKWSDINKPAIFIVFDQGKYLDLLPYLSTATYDWRQTQ